MFTICTKIIKSIGKLSTKGIVRLFVKNIKLINYYFYLNVNVSKIEHLLMYYYVNVDRFNKKRILEC